MSKIYSRRTFRSTVTTGLRPFVPAADAAPAANRTRVLRTSIACPDCKAEPGVPCTSLITGKQATAHKSRERMAIRAGAIKTVLPTQQQALDAQNSGKADYRECPFCKRPIRVRKDGQLRDHRDKGIPCIAPIQPR